MLMVYEHNESVCCQKVRLVLAEKHIEHKLIEVSFEKRETRSPEFLAINPKGVVPVIIHDGRVITESTVIVEYLDDAFPGEQLMPSDPFWRARRRLWARWIDDEMHRPHISTISFNIAFADLLNVGARKDSSPEARAFTAGIESDTMRASLQAYQKFLTEMNRALVENPYLAGPSFSLADIDVVPYIWRLRNLQLAGLWKDMPRIQGWLDRVADRKSFQETIIDSALPSWIEPMKEKGQAAWPRIEKMLASS